MRLRAVAPWLLVPSLLGVVLASWFTVRAVAAERAELEDLAALALRDEALNTAYAWTNAKASALIALDAFTHVPDSLALVANAASMYESRDAALTSFDLSEDLGAAALQGLRTAGGADPAVEIVLAPLDPATRDEIGAGGTALLDPEPYGAALEGLMTETVGADTRAEDALAKLAGFQDRPSFSQDPTFVGTSIALALLAVTGTIVGLWRVSVAARAIGRRAEAAEARADVLHEHSEQMRTLVALARRLTDDNDLGSISRLLVAETRSFVDADTVAVYLRNGAELQPLAVDGTVALVPVAIGDGVVGRCVQTGAVLRTIVPTDPMVAVARTDGDDQPERPPTTVAVLCAPMVAEGQVIGALVVASHSASMFDETDEIALQFIAVLAAGAAQSAKRFDSTLALALHDPLTGIANRRRLDHDLATAAATEAQVSFLMVDIDHFKQFNDRYGHVHGDALLRAVANAITGAVRTGDVVYRYGGEEFSVLLPGADHALAVTIAERVRAAVTAASPPGGCETRVTVSVGVASQSAPIATAALVDCADAALYSAKQAGRDRVVSGVGR